MQFTDDDLDAAVAGGALAPEAAASFRAFVERARATPAADEESFRLLTGFNDIFVAVALVMVLAALAWLAGRTNALYAGAGVALASWGLAEFFTRRRRMALPSILLLLAFVGGVATTALALVPPLFGKHNNPLPGILFVGAVGAAAAFVHWRRFHVPITVAAGALTTGIAVAAAAAAIGGTRDLPLYVVLAEGLAVFALALAWDMSDPRRQTRRADVAFWLHLLAAPAIVHPAFALLGLTQASFFGAFDASAPAAGLSAAATAFLLYAALAVVALIVDRRALMVSSLAYLLYAMKSLFQANGALTVSLALAALIVGSGLLVLSAFWAPARRAALRLTPAAWRTRLPAA